MAPSTDRQNDTDNGPADDQPGLGRRLLWFGLLWVGGVVAVAGFAYGIRAIFGL